MPVPVYTPALDFLTDLADKSAKGQLTLSGSRVVPSSSSQPARIVRADVPAPCRVCALRPNLSGERAYDYVDLSVSTVRIALGVPGAAPYCLATLDTPLPPAAAVITSPQSVTVDLPATKRITLDPPAYGGHFIVTVDDLDPFEVPFDVDAEQIYAQLGKAYRVRKRAANAWEISGTEAGQDVVVSVNVAGLLVPKGVTGEMELNTAALNTAFPAGVKWLRVYREVEIDGVKVFQDDRCEVAREIFNLSALVPVPLPPSDVAAINLALSQKQPSDADLTAIANGAPTTAWGRFLLTLADAGALQTYASLQPAHANLTAFSELVLAAFGASLLTKSSAVAVKQVLLLENVTNVSAANAPVSGPQADADTAVADTAAGALASHAGNTANPHGVTKAQVGLPDAENTADLAKPVSAAQQAAIDAVVAAITDALALKAPLDSPALAGIPTVPTADSAISNTQAASTAFVHALIAQLVGMAPATLNAINELAAAIGNDPNFAVTVADAVATKLAKSANLADLEDVAAALLNLGLNNLNNTSDANKPVSGPQATAINAVATAAADALALVDAAAVHKTGDEIIAGAKDFTGPVGVYSLTGNSITATVLSLPTAPDVTAIGDDEGVIRSYKITALLSDGSETAASPAGTTTHSDETLDADNRVLLTWAPVAGAASYNVYRLTNDGIAPATIGKIATVTIPIYNDTGAVGDGSAPPIVNTTGQVKGALADAGGAFFNVKAFGGVGDGTDDARDSQAIVEAVAAAQVEPNGGTVFFPPGDWPALSQLNITVEKPLNIIGAGWGAKILWKGTGHLFNWTVTGRWLHVSNLFISMRNAANATKDVFHFGRGCHQSTFDRIYTDSSAPFKAGTVFNLAGVTEHVIPGQLPTNTIAWTTGELTFTNCYLYKFVHCGIRLGAGARVVISRIHCLPQYEGDIGIHLTGDNGGVVIDSSDVLGCKQVGIWLDKGKYVYGSDVAGWAGHTEGAPTMTNREINFGQGVYADTCKIGLRVDDGCKLTWNGVGAAACKYRGILVTDGYPDLIFAGGSISNNGANGPHPDGVVHGMEMQSGQLMMTGVKVDYNYHPGTNNGIGVIIGAGVNVSIITGCRFSVNYQALQHAGPNHKITGNIFDTNQTWNSVTGGGESQYRNNTFVDGVIPGELDGTARKTYTATPTNNIGNFTAATGTGRYDRLGKQINCTISGQITTDGTVGGLYVRFPLPFPVVNPAYLTGYGTEVGETGRALAIQAEGASAIIARFVDASGPAYPGGNNRAFVINVSYEMP